MGKPEHNADDHQKISEREHHHDDEPLAPILAAMFNEHRAIRIGAGEIEVQLACLNKQFRGLLRFLECTKQNPQGGHADLATKQDLKEMETRIMATQAEVVAVLTSARDSLKQVNLDVAASSVKLGELTNKITELEAAIANGVVGQELADIAAEVKTLAGAADEALPNPVTVPPIP